MENKLFDGLKNKNITESSLKLYLSNLKRLNEGQEIKNFNFLKDVEKILDKIKHYKPNTRRSYLISIVSLLKQEPKFASLYQKYYNLLMEYNKELKVQNVKTEKQTDNWISQDEVRETFNNLEAELLPKLQKKKLSPVEYEQLLNFLVLSLYVLQPPRRNLDYQYMVVVKQYNENMNEKYNYLSLDDSAFYFNNYKTKGTYKTQSVLISPELKKIIDLYLKFYPYRKMLKKKDAVLPFLVNAEGEPFEATNTITRILNKIFKKKIGCSLLRNIYLTDKYADKTEQMKTDANDMGTSTNTMNNVYIKVDEMPETKEEE